MAVRQRRIVSRALPGYARLRRAQFRTKRLRAGAASFALTGSDATLELVNTKVLTAEAAAYAVTGQAASLRVERRLAAEAAGFALTGQDAGFQRVKHLAAEAAAFALTGLDAGLRVARRVVAEAASFALTGADAGLFKGKQLDAEAGGFDLTGTAATLRKSTRVSAGAGALALTGTDASVLLRRKVVAGAASYALTGQDATLTIESPSPTAFTFVASAVSNANTITIPAGAQAGDLAVLIDFAHNGGSGVPANVVPTDWTQLATATQDAGSNDTRITASRKILVGGDPGASITGMDQTNDNKVMLVFRADAPITSLSVGTWNAEATFDNPASQNVAAAAAGTPSIVIGGAACETSTAAFSTASPAFDATVATADLDLIVGYKIYNSSPADHTIDMADLGNANALVSGFIKAS